jgi:hypothetical protein
MDSSSCDECWAIYRELRDAFRVLSERSSDQNTAPQQLAAWLEQLDQEECARMRETSAIWKTWRRLQEHRAVTGHPLSLLPVPPNAISNPN